MESPRARLPLAVLAIAIPVLALLSLDGASASGDRPDFEPPAGVEGRPENWEDHDPLVDSPAGPDTATPITAAAGKAAGDTQVKNGHYPADVRLPVEAYGRCLDPERCPRDGSGKSTHVVQFTEGHAPFDVPTKQETQRAFQEAALATARTLAPASATLLPERPAASNDRPSAADSPAAPRVGLEAPSGSGLTTPARSPEPSPTRVVPAGSAPAAPEGGAGLASAPVVALALGALALSAFVASLYTRLSRASLLKNPVRARALEHVRAHPGASASDVSEAVGVHLTTAQYHLRVLAKHQFVVEREVGGRAWYFEPGHAPVDAATFHTPGAKTVARVLEAVSASPGASVSEIARAARLSRQLVSYHVQKLAAAGALRVESGGASLRVFPPNA